MASAKYNAGLKALLDGTATWNSGSITIRALLVSSAYTFNPDHATLSSITNELSGTGYTRKDVTSRTLTTDNTNDRVAADAADITWTGLNAGTPAACVIYLRVGADDSTPGDDIPLFYMDQNDIVTNGGDYTLAFDPIGVATFT